MTYKYSLQVDLPEEKLSRAQVADLDASYKDLTQVCAAIRSKHVSDAMQVLQDAIDEKKAIEYKRFSKGAGHKSNLGGKKGRYPKKECRFVMALLENAVANGVNKGLNREAMQVYHAAAFKQQTYPRYKRYFAGGMTLGYGKQSHRADYETARVELVLYEKGLKEKKKAEKVVKPKASKKKVSEAKA